MADLVFAVLVLVAVLTSARRLARSESWQLVKDIAASVSLLIRWVVGGVRLVVRLVRREARSW